MVIEYYVVKNYGRLDRYVADKEIAKAFSLITGKKTLDDQIVKGFQMLGAEFNEVVAPKQ